MIGTASKWELLLLSPCGAAVEQLLPPEDALHLTQCSKLLLAGKRLLRRHSTDNWDFPLLEERSRIASAVHNVISREFYSAQRGRKSKQRGRLSVGQVAVLLEQLLLVASGIRPACLVDHCALEIDAASFLLNSLERMEPLGSYQDVTAVFLGDNTFFINVPVFVREKFLDLASNFSVLVLVNASSDVGFPVLIPSLNCTHDAEDRSPVERRVQVAEAVRSICAELLAARESQPRKRVIDWVPQAQLSHPAIAGLLLCYPVVYDVSPSSSGEDSHFSDEWAGQGNCLAMCPLTVVQSGISFADEPELSLQSFSVPTDLLDHADLIGNATSDKPMSMLPVLKAGTRRRIARSMFASGLHQASAPVRIRVDSATEILAHVAI